MSYGYWDIWAYRIWMHLPCSAGTSTVRLLVFELSLGRVIDLALSSYDFGTWFRDYTLEATSFAVTEYISLFHGFWPLVTPFLHGTVLHQGRV